MSDGLTKRQRVFIAEYLKDLNGTRAAIAAGYSEKTACEQGSRLLAKVKVQEAVGRAMDERAERLKLDSDYVLRGIVNLVECTKGTQPAVALRGYELLGKHLKLFTDKFELKNELSDLSSEELEQQFHEVAAELGYVKVQQ